MASEGLFSADLLSPEVGAALPEGYKLRPLRPTDFGTGFLDCLRVLTTVGEISKEQFEERYAWLSRQEGGYYVLVIEDTNAEASKVVGTGALIVERKLYVFALEFPVE
jgi:glucosamine-phosphate N-acetyltransferase